MILHHLAIVAKVVHDHYEKYDVLKHQCFWYSDAITGVLEKHFSLQVSKAKVSDSSLTADYTKEAEMEVQVFDDLSGTCKKFKIYKRPIDVIDEIHAKFDEYKKDIETSVNLLNVAKWYIFAD